MTLPASIPRPPALADDSRAAASVAAGEILFETRGLLGLITLNRPEALNALTHGMALALEAKLRDWIADDAVAAVAIQGAGDKAFCAGGDIRQLYDTGQADPARDGAGNFAFYADEYRLNTLIKRYPKPYVSLIDGICMGGGVGVSIHGRYRIGGDRLVFAMPETGIGLIPDVGATFFLPRLPRHAGFFAGLTGARMKAADCVETHVVDYYVRSETFPALLEAMAAAPFDDDSDEVLSELIATHASPPPPAPLKPHLDAVDEIFGAESVSEILARLDAGNDWAQKQAAVIRQKSPTSTSITHRQLRAGAGLTFEDCMRLEYRLARHCMTHPDFYEGVRAVIIDKDGAPHWRPATLDTVDPAEIEQAFAPLGDEELPL
ncbi:MAG: enoyl-CoA hydratase/isomerase family protein [Pseudomonadota bacterium]